MTTSYDVIVAGHICVDLIPTFLHGGKSPDSVLSPGRLINVGAMVTATGGAVANAGGALNRFGIRTALCGRVGKDDLGTIILDNLQSRNETTEYLCVIAAESTSYTVVLNIPGVDRIPLHNPGANDTFDFATVSWDVVDSCRLFHFGYPPLMKSMFVDSGRNLVEIMKHAKSRGVTTSLDMARPDPDAESGRVDWMALLQNALKYVDIFHPSIDELIFMIDLPRFTEFENNVSVGKLMGGWKTADLKRYCSLLHDWGPSIVAIKLGNAGLFVSVASDSKKLSPRLFGRLYYPGLEKYEGSQIYQPCFKVDVIGAIGAGDCTIAGFLAGLLTGQSIPDACRSAVGAGACNVEYADALSGIPDWDILQERLSGVWELRPGIE